MKIWHSQHEDEYRSTGATRVRGLSPRNRALWSEAATSSGRREMVVYQIHPQEEAARCVGAVSREKQAQCVKMENVERTQQKRTVKKNVHLIV